MAIHTGMVGIGRHVPSCIPEACTGITAAARSAKNLTKILINSFNLVSYCVALVIYAYQIAAPRTTGIKKRGCKRSTGPVAAYKVPVCKKLGNSFS